MAIYQPFIYKNNSKRRTKKYGFRLGLLLLISTLVSLCWILLSGPLPRDAASSRIKDPTEGILPRLSNTMDMKPFKEGTSERIQSAKDKVFDESYRMVDGVLQKGDTLYEFLVDKDVKKTTISILIEYLEPIMPFNTAMPGDTFALTLDSIENLHRFEYNSGPMETYIIERDPNGELGSFKKEVILQKYWEVISGKVVDSLFNSILSVSETPSLASKFADIFAWKIDFHNEPRKNDKFHMVVEKFCYEGKFMEYGRILAAEYNGYCGLHQAIFYIDDSGNGDYYDLNGVSIQRAFLRAPLRFNRISSGYSYKRRHPILGIVRPHLGIDYAAPSGTPVWTVADGTVMVAKYMGGNGNQVIIKHMNGYKSYYNHLSRFGRGIKKGVKVRQKQVIGYVGTTGLSTGPHLDYRVKRNNKFINPLKADFPVGEKLVPNRKKVFHQNAYNLLHFMYDNQKEKLICKVAHEDRKNLVNN